MELEQLGRVGSEFSIPKRKQVGATGLGKDKFLLGQTQR
jgi:hypothetical protein